VTPSSRWAFWKQPVTLLAIVVTWCLLWADFSLANLLNGLIVAILVVTLFPMPPLQSEIALRPLHAIWFTIRFLADLFTSAALIASYALRPSGSPPSSVIAIHLRSRSDLFLTLTAEVLSLIPGSIVVEAQRTTGTLYLHVIGAVTDEDRERSRRTFLQQEVRILRAFASRATLEEAGLR
jgi:multicomponent Na+:H+ antiporter subunit E